MKTITKKLMEGPASEKISPDDIRNKIAEAHISIKPSKQAIIFLGDTAAGKSPLCNYIAGIPLIAIKHKMLKIIIEVNTTGHSYFSKIGHHTVSETTNPISLDYDDGVTIWDAPGFGDTRKANVDIPNCYMIKTLFQKTEKCKVVFVVSQDSLKDGNRSQTFIRRINNIIQLFNDISKVKKSVFLAVTRVKQKDFVNDAELCEFIRRMIDDHPEFTESQRTVMELFTDNDRVILFSQPTSEGNIPESDRDIFRIKFEKLPFVEVGEVDLSLSDDSKEVIKEMCGNLFKEIKESYEMYVGSSFAYFEDLIKCNYLDQNLIDGLRTQIEDFKETNKCLNSRTTSGLFAIIDNLKKNELFGNKGELVQIISLLTQKIENFNFFLDILEIELVGSNLFDVNHFYSEVLNNMYSGLKNQEQLLKTLIEIQTNIRASIDEAHDLIQLKINELIATLRITEKEFHGLTFNKHQKLEEFFEKIEFLRQYPLFQSIIPYLDQIKQVINESKKEGIFEYLNQTKYWVDFWKKVREAMRQMEFPLIEDYFKVGLLGKEKFANEFEKNDFFQRFMELKCKEILEEINQIDVLAAEFEQEKDEHFKENEYVAILDSENKKMSSSDQEKVKRITQLLQQKSTLEQALTKLQSDSLKGLQEKNQNLEKNIKSLKETKQKIESEKEESEKHQGKIIESELELQKTEKKNIESNLKKTKEEIESFKSSIAEKKELIAREKEIENNLSNLKKEVEKLNSKYPSETKKETLEKRDQLQQLAKLIEKRKKLDEESVQLEKNCKELKKNLETSEKNNSEELRQKEALYQQKLLKNKNDEAALKDLETLNEKKQKEKTKILQEKNQELERLQKEEKTASEKLNERKVALEGYNKSKAQFDKLEKQSQDLVKKIENFTQKIFGIQFTGTLQEMMLKVQNSAETVRKQIADITARINSKKEEFYKLKLLNTERQNLN